MEWVQLGVIIAAFGGTTYHTVASLNRMGQRIDQLDGRISQLDENTRKLGERIAHIEGMLKGPDIGIFE